MRVGLGHGRRDERPKAVPLGAERDVEEQRVGMVPTEHLHADRQAADGAGRDGTPRGP